MLLPVRVFYHVACMNHWRTVVMEQWDLIRRVGFPVVAGVLGSKEDRNWVRSLGLEVGYWSENLEDFEHPTLELLWKWARENKSGAVCYVHTKGVSQPGDFVRWISRQIMNMWVLRRWVDCWQALDDCDVAGVNWFDLYGWRHFCGNFWWARCDWISKLPNPWDFRRVNSESWNFREAWQRLSAEMWLASSLEACPRVKSFMCTNEKFWVPSVAARWLRVTLLHVGNEGRIEDVEELFTRTG